MTTDKQSAEDVQPHDSGQPTSEQRAREAFDLAERLDFRDHDGAPIRPGTLVHYLPRRQVEETVAYGFPGSVWNTRRWGIVVGILANTDADGEALRTVFVQAVVVKNQDSMWGARDEWSCSPDRLRVVSNPTGLPSGANDGE